MTYRLVDDVRAIWDATGDFMILVDRRDGRVFRVNTAGGSLIDKLPRNSEETAESERSFYEQLVRNGMATIERGPE
jgi:hypothetical protein